MLVKLDKTRAPNLTTLDDCVIPIEPVQTKYKISVVDSDEKTSRCTFERRQFPITAAYAFTDYRSQGQTITCAFVDIANPPTGGLSLFNLYVALSRSSGRDVIRLLRDFDDQIFLMARYLKKMSCWPNLMKRRVNGMSQNFTLPHVFLAESQ